MKKLDGKKINIAVLISGTGSNLKSLINYSRVQKVKYKIQLVISNNSKAKGLHYAKLKIDSKFISYSNHLNAEKKILTILKKNKINLICLAGFMKILSKKFIRNFKGKILNIPPSLLPKYKGLDTHKRALANNEKYSGCTVHFVNSKLDSGKIILQKKVKIKKNDTIKKLAKRVLLQEHILYPKALNKVLINY